MTNYNNFNTNTVCQEITANRDDKQTEYTGKAPEVNSETDDFMPDFDECFEVPEYQLPKGPKIVKISDLMKAGEVYGKYGPIPRVAVDLELPDGSVKRERVLIVANPKSVWKQLLRAALGKTSGKFKKSEIIGKRVVVEFEHNEVDGNVYSNVVEVHPVE